MSGDLCTIKYVRNKSCFLYVSERWIRKMQDMRKLDVASMLKVVYGDDKVAYFTWQRGHMKEECVVGINATFATRLGLKEEECVALSISSSPASVQKVEMFPLTTDDLDIIGESSNTIQSSLLDQVRVIWKGQILTTWVSNTFPVNLLVGDLDPHVPVGRLEQLTEVAIGPPVNRDMLVPEPLQDNSSISKWLNYGQNFAHSVASSIKQQEIQEREPDLSPKRPLVCRSNILRVHPLRLELPQYSPCDVFVPEQVRLKIIPNGLPTNGTVICKMTKLQLSKDNVQNKHPKSKEEASEKHALMHHSDEKDQYTDRETVCMFVRVRSLNVLQGHDKVSFNPGENSIFISHALRLCVSIDIGSRVKLTFVKSLTNGVDLKTIELIPYHGEDCIGLEESFISCVQNAADGLHLSSGMTLTLPSPRGYIDVEVELAPHTLPYALVTPDQLDHLRIIVKTKKPPGHHKLRAVGLSLKTFPPKSNFKDLYKEHLQGVLEEGLLSLQLTLGIGSVLDEEQKLNSTISNILILGKKGIGKTSTVDTLRHPFEGSPHFVHFSVVSCRPLKGKKVETLMKLLQTHVQDCIYHQPSVLVLDDLDSIAGVSHDQDQDNPRKAYFNRVGKMLVNLLRQVQSNHRVAVVGTSISTSSLCSSLISPRGVHFFSTFLELPELNKENRQSIIGKLLAKKLESKEVRSILCSTTLEDCGGKTEGYSCQDLSDLIDRAVFVAWKRQGASSMPPALETSDILGALSFSTPMLFRGINLQKVSSCSWSDVGGLASVKEVMKEVLQWPMMYPELFQDSPLRHQSGLLLYGAPGTGKTMLAGAIANECDLNFISVKGPELLSKYIGASEEAVRNIFQKAQSAKPCILFFDEFDSLAPRRGHDSTGVTDRVVNQLLTQLDGVESLSGVWVLAASSRPDLLDPALLRPGRLDRSVLCPLPDMNDRLSILVALSQKLILDEDVNLAEIAAETEEFTGADIQAVLYTAQLKAVEEHYKQRNDDNGSEKISGQSNVVIRQEHLRESLESTRPSLSVKERNRYTQIYERFSRAGNGDFSDVSSLPQRATLA